MFTSWAALKKHLVGPAHTRMTVICPWCTKREKTFTRIADLKTHALNIHRLEGVQDRHFSRGVGFYFAKYPVDYVKIVDYVADYADENATEVRSLMRKWAESMEGSVGLLERLNKGCKVEKDVGRNRGQEKIDKRREEKSKSREMSRTEEKSRSKERSGDRRTVMDKRSRSDDNTVRMDEKGDSDKTEKGSKKDQIRDKGNVNLLKDSVSVGGHVDVPSQSGEKKRQQSQERERVLKKPRTLQEEDSEEEGLDSYTDDIRLGESVTDSSDSESKEDGLSGVSSVASAVAQTELLRIRATRVLMRGAMPIYPSSQWDWSKVSELDIEGHNGSMVWPPKNWRTMTPDQKLLAHEYAVLFLEQSKTGSFPVDLSRRALLDKYNFMALEGAARPKPESSKHKADAKLRYYNFQYIRNVARGSVPDSRVSRSIVTSMERADRWRDTDRLTDMLDNVNIKLRV